MAQKFVTPITIKQLSSAGSDGLTIYVDADSYARLQIQGGGRLVWGDGASAGDVNLYRDAADVLKTDDTLKVPALFIDGIEVDTTGATSAQVLSYNGTKFVPTAAAAGGSSVTVSDTAPVSPTAGDVWYESDTGILFVRYDSYWVEVGGDVSSSATATTSATDLISGTLDNARLPAAATNITSVGTLTSLTVSGTVTVPTPTNSTDAVTKAYADAITQSLDIKDSVRVASTVNIAVASDLTNTSTIDGVVVATGDRVLLKNQTTGAENGIYVVVASGAASRSTDANTSAKVTSGMYVFVSEGTVSADMGYVLTTNDAITLGTTSLSFTQFSGAGQITAGTGLSKSGNTLSIDTAVTVNLTTAQTLTNKTLTSPVVNTPTGIVKGDIGLGNVDNTSNATERAATATLTNKTLTTPVINGVITGTGQATANTASTIVMRDASGNFSAGTITAALTGTASGNLVSGGALGTPSSGTLTNCTFPTLNQSTTGSAATLTNTRTLWGQNFNGSANVSGALTGATTVALSGATSGTTTVQASAVAGTTTITLPAITGTVVTTGDTGSVTSTMILDGTILNADINASAGIVDTKLATISTASKVSNSATTATNANTASAIVARDASGNFAAGTITAALTGTASGNLVSGGALGTPSSGTLTNCTFPTLNQNTTGTAATVTGAAQTAITSVGTLGTLAVTGDLTVDTDTLKVDSTNNRVGIGTASPSFLLDIQNPSGSASTAVRITNLGTGTSFLVEDSTSPDSTMFMIDAGGLVGIGGVPSTRLTVVGTATATTFAGSGASLTSIPNSATTATNANTASAIVARDASGNFAAGTITAALTGTASDVANASVIGKLLTGYVSGSGTVSATDTILQAIQKLNGNTDLKASTGKAIAMAIVFGS